MKLTYEDCYEIAENMVFTAFGMAHEKAQTKSGDETGQQMLKKEDITKQLAELIQEQTNQNL